MATQWLPIGEKRVKKITRKLTQRAVDNTKHSDVVKELRLDPSQAHKRQFVWDGQIPGYGLQLTPLGAVSFVLFYKFDKKSRKLTIGNARKMKADDARAVAAATVQAVARGEDPKAPPESEVRPLTVNEAFKDFLSKPKRDGSMRAASTIDKYTRDFDRFVAPIIGSMPIADVRQKDSNKVLQAALAGDPDNPRLKDRGNRTVQYNRVRAILKALLHWAFRREETKIWPKMEDRFAETSRIPGVEQTDIAELTGALRRFEKDTDHRPWVVTVFWFLLYTAARSGEVMQLQWADVDWERRRIALRSFKGVTRANAKPQWLDISPQVEELLHRAARWRRPGNDHIFPGRDPHYYRGINKDWVRFREEYLKQGLRMHDLRHLALSTGLNAGGLNHSQLQAVARHSSQKTTGIYVHHATQTKYDAACAVAAAVEKATGGTS